MKDLFRRFGVVITALLVTSIAAFAETNRTIDARTLFAPSKAPVSSQVVGAGVALDLRYDVAEDVFGSRPASLDITNLSIPGNGTVTLQLRRSRDVYDANTQFINHAGKGPELVKVRPISSYVGTVEGQPESRVSLHYTGGELMGFIQFEDGSRQLVGLDQAVRRTASIVPHSIQPERTSASGELLRNFSCGVEEEPVTQEDFDRVIQSMKIEERVQDEYLRQFDLLIVLKEDIDSVMKARGLNDEQIFQYIGRVFAAVSQAYEQDLDVTIYLKQVNKYTMEEPTGYFFDGSEPRDLLGEFTSDWSQPSRQEPARTLGHIMAWIRPRGGSFVGGVGWGAGMRSNLCNPRNSQSGSYSISTLYLNASEIPGRPNSANGFVWDVFVVAHEMGHNIGAAHTHNCTWSPPVDTCVLGSDGTDACFDQSNMRRVRPGTIMSYCHLYNGNSTLLDFGDRVASRMKTWIAQSPCVNFVTEPYVRITSPRGPEAYTGGSNIVIQFVSANVSTVRFEYSSNDGQSWEPITNSVNAVDRTYTWTLPFVQTSQLLIRISDASNPSVNHIAPARYAINVPLVLNNPTGGERIAQGSTFPITWTKLASVSGVDVLLSIDGGEFEKIAGPITNGNQYNWVVPNVVTENARIRVVASANAGIQATSGAFAIGARRFALEIPAANGSICKDVDNQFRWSADYIDRIRIQYSTNNGADWVNALRVVNVRAADWQIFSRATSLANLPTGSTISLRVQETSTNDVLATLDGIRVDSCGTVVSVDEDGASTGGLSIISIVPNPATDLVEMAVYSPSAQTVSIDIVDMAGATTTILSNVNMQGSGTTVVNVPVSTLSTGMYSIVVRTDAGSTMTPLRIIR